MRALTLREKIGQLIVTGFPSTGMTEDLKRLIADYKIGNIILFSHNIANKSQLRELCGELRHTITQHTGFPALISIDQEGGRVTRLPADATNMPGAMATASTGRPENAYAAGRITARELRALGINFNLAPVLDINNNKHNPVINVRSYGDTPGTVETYGLQMIRGLMEGGVLSSVKHFPGHGDTAVDSHLGLPVIDKSLEQLMELELKPFRAAIAAGAEGIMSSHILFPQIETTGVPATMSRTIITDLLKKRLGYGGLVVSDCLEMDAIKKYYGTARGALGAIQAGVHLVFVSHTPALVIEAAELIEQAVNDGELPMSVIDDALERVMYVKRKYGDTGESDLNIVGSDAHRRAAAAISEESICLVHGELETVRRGGGDTIFIGSPPYRTDQASSQAKSGLSFPAAMAEAFDAASATIGIDPDEEEIERTLRQAEGYGHSVIGLFNGRENAGQLKLARKLAASGHKVTAVALGKPYDLEELGDGACGLAAFEYTPLAIASLIRVLGGEILPTGKLSIEGA
ncbi:glycoside hydrolase family 3 protein [Paenibacillus sacheonensis]|uniref:beta-N-acetylhexosaminidase n=1 Tax=Paenibacillus sacheonensis TaxID=742054 RepID=A0A7X4YS09_9BACL|nr:glycoside hydrolase family 3 protein [Paenibacillus sacheonensis]MBM7566836.1 beta-N-acetylhexosaminidase [Paenibacillus sacheonensis]NBC71458.1 glycoside hydrolase family 3 [Paenibacillus sacheonensis]